MEKLPIDSEKYLEKIKRTNFDISHQEIEDSISRLSKPFDSVMKTEKGFEIDYEGVKINIEYRPFTYIKDEETYTSREMKVIDRFQIKDEDKEFDLLSILPPGIRIIVQSGSEKETGNILDVNGVNEISIAGEIDSPKMIAVVLHEIGHIIDMTKLSEVGLNGFEAEFRGLMDDKENSDIAEKIRKERVANAFALKVLKPFLKNSEIKKDMLNLLKYDALASYYYSAKKELEKRGQRSYHSHYNSMDVGDFSGDEW